jgi:hypothetical protein
MFKYDGFDIVACGAIGGATGVDWMWADEGAGAIAEDGKGLGSDVCVGRDAVVDAGEECGCVEALVCA